MQLENPINEELKINNIFDVVYIKNKSFNTWQAIQQAEENSEPNRIPLVVFHRNRSKNYAIIEFEKLIELLADEKSRQMELIVDRLVKEEDKLI